MALAGLSGPSLVLRVREAAHTDPERPTDWLAQLVCGKADPARHVTFEQYAIAVLKAVFFKDSGSIQVLTAATNDAALEDVTTRSFSSFGI